MSNLFNTLFQTIKTELPNLNWKLGSAIRTLVVDPLSVMSANIDKAVSAISAVNELDAALAAPSEHEGVLDIWMRKLNIQQQLSATSSTGTIKIVRTNAAPMTIEAGTEFTWDSSVYLVATKTTMWGIAGGSNYDVLVPGSAYVAELTVVATSDYPVSISSGSPINWHGADENVLDVYVANPVTGGVVLNAETKAKLIQGHLESPTMCGSAGVRSAILRKFPNTVADALVGIRTFDRGSCEVPVFIKQNSYPGLQDGGTVSATESANVINWLNSQQSGSPFKMVGSTPNYAFVSLTINAGEATKEPQLLADICAYINQARLNETLSDTVISTILSNYGLTLKSPVTYSVQLIGANGTTYNVTQMGNLSLMGYGAVGNTPFATYCNMGAITIY